MNRLTVAERREDTGPAGAIARPHDAALPAATARRSPDVPRRPPPRPEGRRACALRPALRRLRPGAGPDRGRVRLPDHREVRRQRGSGVPDPRDPHQGRARGPREAPPRRPVARLLQARAPRDGPQPARAVLERVEAGLEGEGLDRHRGRAEAARPHRPGRRRVEGHGRRGQDARRGSPRLTFTFVPQRAPEAPSSDGASSHRIVRGERRTDAGRRAVRGLWRVTVADGSMLPAIAPGDWLLVDPTVARWPRRGSIVVFREPGSGLLAIKRVEARPGDWIRFADGWLRMGEDEAWLRGDASDDDLAAAGHGPAVDSRRDGPGPGPWPRRTCR